MGREVDWSFRSPVDVRFGTGAIDGLASAVTGRVLVVTTPGMTGRGVTDRLVGILGGHDTVVHDAVEPNPTIARLTSAIDRWRGHDVNTIVAVGGGSALDTGKVMSVGLADRDFDLRRALMHDVVVEGPTGIPVVAVPTTAGTGSEVTPFATVWDESLKRKRSLAGPGLFPATALLDPSLTVSLPWPETLGPGLDAYVQCAEAIWSRNATPVTTAFAEKGLEIIPSALRTLRSDPASLEARSEMQCGALLSGLAISNTRTGLAHSISYPLTAHLGVPHGLACALALPGVLAFNTELVAAAPQPVHGASIDLDELDQLYDDLGVVDALRAYLPDFSAVYGLVPEMLTPGRAENNVRAASHDDVRRILATCELKLGRTTEP